MSELHSAASSPVPLFFLQEPGPEGTLLLEEDELQHLRVLRLKEGDACLGMDGMGRRWPLVIRSIGRRQVELEASADPTQDPAPGRPGAALPWIEMCIAWPRKTRAEPMIGSLVQLGAACITPLAARHRGPEPLPKQTPKRWIKLAQSALKQSERTWMPQFSPTMGLEEWCQARKGAAMAVFDPLASTSLDTWLRSLRPAPIGTGSPERPICLILGPEGGLAAEEQELLLEAGASRLWLAPHILRIETAACAAMALAACVLGNSST